MHDFSTDTYPEWLQRYGQIKGMEDADDGRAAAWFAKPLLHSIPFMNWPIPVEDNVWLGQMIAFRQSVENYDYAAAGKEQLGGGRLDEEFLSTLTPAELDKGLPL